MGDKTCETCRHFCQHYTRLKNFWLSLDEGHCIHARLKKRTVTSPACQHYSAREDTPPITLKGELSFSIHDIPPEITQLLVKSP